MGDRSDILGREVDHCLIESLDDVNRKADLDLFTALGGSLDVELSPPYASGFFPCRNFEDTISPIGLGLELNGCVGPGRPRHLVAKYAKECWCHVVLGEAPIQG